MKPGAVKGIFDIKKGDVISFVGAGGKTSLLSDIATELSSSLSVAVAATTKKSPFDSHVFEIQFGPTYDFRRVAGERQEKKRISAFFGEPDGKGKCLPIGDSAVSHLTESFDVVLLEADGARGKSLKFPRGHEPVVPEVSNKVVWVVGADVIGRRFWDELVFNRETYAAAGLPSDDEINVSNLRRSLFATGGYLDRLPGQGIYLVLNKIDVTEGFKKDFVRFLWHSRLSELVLSYKENNHRRFETVSNQGIPVAGIILAAGSSERFGSDKLLAQFAGAPLISRTVNATLESNLRGIYAVIPANSPGLRAFFESSERIDVVENPDAQLGISSSVRTGLRRLMRDAEDSPPAVMFLLADMPNVDARLVNSVLSSFEESGAPMCSVFEKGRSGHPAVFHSVMFDEILSISGDEGCRGILRRDPEMVRKVLPGRPGTQCDIDIPEDIERMSQSEQVLRGIA